MQNLKTAMYEYTIFNKNSDKHFSFTTDDDAGTLKYQQIYQHDTMKIVH